MISVVLIHVCVWVLLECLELLVPMEIVSARLQHLLLVTRETFLVVLQFAFLRCKCGDGLLIVLYDFAQLEFGFLVISLHDLCPQLITIIEDFLELVYGCQY